MPGRPTDHARRDLAELHRAVIRGTSGGQVIWQPRIGCWFDDKRFAGEPFPAPYEGLSDADIFRSLGCSTRLYWFNACFVAHEDPAVKGRYERLNEWDHFHAVETPVGTQTAIYRSSPNNKGQHPLKRWIETPDDLRVATWRAYRTTWSWSQETYDRLLVEWGDLGLPTMFMPRESVQDLYINTMGVERAVFALADWRDEVEEYFRALDDSDERLLEVICASPIEPINFGDNLHASTLSPRLYERYIEPVYHRRCTKLRAAGKWTCAHWDGDTGPLLPYAKRSQLDGIEAITPLPQGDTTLEQVKDALGDEVFLLDGIPAIYFDEQWPLSVLEECTWQLLELFAPKLILGISDELSSHGDIERIRVVGAIVDEFNARRAG